jgi:hypothetical protein
MPLTNTRKIPGVLISCLLLFQCSKDPAGASPDYASAALRNPRFHWDSIVTPTFTLYTNRGSYGAERASRYREEVESGISHALKMLGETRSPPHIKVLVLGSRDDVEAITGTGWNGWGDAPGKNFGVVARAECAPVFRHEAMHVVSLWLWGHPLGPQGEPGSPTDSGIFARGGWLREGIAAAAEDRYLSYSYRGMAAQWLAEGTLLPLDTLEHAFYRADDLAAYLQAGSLVQYLLGTYGPERFRMVWREGVNAFDRAYGRTRSQIETEWHDWLRATPATERPRSIQVARDEDICPPRRR